MSTHTQLTQEQRYQIAVLLKAGHTQTEIANVIEVNKSTISRELSRNRGKRGYRPQQAHELSLARRRDKQKSRIAAEHWQWVEQLLRDDWSPEQISLWLSAAGRCSVSPEWIYQYVYEDKRRGGALHRHLRCQKQRRKRYGSNDRRGGKSTGECRLISAQRSLRAVRALVTGRLILLLAGQVEAC